MDGLCSFLFIHDYYSLLFFFDLIPVVPMVAKLHLGFTLFLFLPSGKWFFNISLFY